MSKKPTRPKFRAKEVTLLDCEPGNFDGSNGEKATVIMIAATDHIEPLVMTMKDSKKLVVELLVCLMSNEDEVAAKILAESFSVRDGRFCWPSGE